MISSILRAYNFEPGIMSVRFTWTTSSINFLHWQNNIILESQKYPYEVLVHTSNGKDLELLTETAPGLLQLSVNLWKVPYNIPNLLAGYYNLDVATTNPAYQRYYLYRTSDMKTFTKVNSRLFDHFSYIWDGIRYIIFTLEYISGDRYYKIMTSTDLITFSDISIYTKSTALTNGYNISYTNGKYILVFNNFDNQQIKIFDSYEELSINSTNIIPITSTPLQKPLNLFRVDYFGNKYITNSSNNLLYTKNNLTDDWMEFIIDIEPTDEIFGANWAIWDNYIFYSYYKRATISSEPEFKFYCINQNFKYIDFSHVLLINDLPKPNGFGYKDKIFMYTRGDQNIYSKYLDLDFYFI